MTVEDHHLKERERERSLLCRGAMVTRRTILTGCVVLVAIGMSVFMFVIFSAAAEVLRLIKRILV